MNARLKPASNWNMISGIRTFVAQRPAVEIACRVRCLQTRAEHANGVKIQRYSWTMGAILECPLTFDEVEEIAWCKTNPSICYQHYSCGDCLGEGCYWDPSANRCAEECSPDTTTCLSPDEVPNSETLLEYCLLFGKRLSQIDCDVTFHHPKGITYPCPHCLSNGCAWDDGKCCENCTNGTNMCVTALNLDGKGRLESRLSAFCADSQTVECPTCIEVELNFDKDASGNSLAPGTCVGDEWAAYGLTLVAGGGYGDLPCLFDTANPVTGKHGDPDLGAPNNRCPGGGPGIGEGGEPDGKGPNCTPLGNVLIIQEPGTNGVPDDNVDGGLIAFTFSPVAEYVKEIGLLDVDYKTSISVLYVPDDGSFDEDTITVPIKGDNSYQVVPINSERVRQIVLRTERSLAVTSLSFCYTTKVVMTPCNELVTVDFNTDANGNAIEAGRYVEDEWLSLGMTLQAEGGENTLPRILDSADPGGETKRACGDSDLGTPNEKCLKNPGPGRGIGGEPGSLGENCEPLGNVLIVQEPGSDCPDDNVDGGIITFGFSYPDGQYVKEIGLIDIDYKSSISVFYADNSGILQDRQIGIDLIGDNAVQTVEIDQDHVNRIKLRLERSGGVTSITFCPKK